MQREEQMRASMMSGNSYRSTSKVFGVPSGTISKTMHSSEDGLTPETHPGGRREVLVEVTPKIVSDLSSLILDHPQATQQEMG